MTVAERKAENRISDFRSIVAGIVGNSIPITSDTAPDEKAPDSAVKWNSQTRPPTLAPVALADARNDPIIRDWLAVRVLDIAPEVKYRADRLYNLGTLYNMSKEDARQEMSALALERSIADPQWALGDNALIAFDAGRRVHDRQRIARNWSQRNLAFSLDEPSTTDSELTRLDSIMTTRAKVALTHFPLFPTRNGWKERPEIVLESDLWPAIRQLTPIQKNVFLLSRFWGMKLHDIASRYGIAYGTAKSHNSRAKKMLRFLIPHMDSNRVVPQCPACGSRSLCKPDGNESNRRTCQICQHTASAGQFDTPIQDRPAYYLGRQGKNGIAPKNWTRTLADHYPIAKRTPAATRGPTIPREDTPTISTMPKWAPDDCTTAEPWKWNGTLADAMSAYRAQFAPRGTR